MLVAVVYKCVPCYCDAVQVSRLQKIFQPVIKGLSNCQSQLLHKKYSKQLKSSDCRSFMNSLLYQTIIMDNLAKPYDIIHCVFADIQ